MLLSPNSPCALVSSSSVPTFTKRTRRAGTEGKVRRKRAWIFPGTLWCGTGSKAAGYEQLGMFESADRCCREHDHCLHVILSFTVNYGVFNSNLFTVSQCDCDQRFRQCLLGVNDTISSMVGYSFFNILKVPCFELKQQKQCTELYWWGMCKVAKKAPYAVFKKPLPYSDVTSNNGDNANSNTVARSKGNHETKSFVINPNKKSPKGERRCNSRDRLKGDTFYLRRTEEKGCKRHRKLDTTPPSQMPPMSRVHTTSPSIQIGLLNASKSTVMMQIKKRLGKRKSNRKGLSNYVTERSQVPQTTTTTTSARQSSPSLTQKPALQLHLPTAITAVTRSHKEVPKQSHCCGFKMLLRENQLLCGSLILLDGCKYKIIPLEKKYDLQNGESKTAYHCDCTSRLAVQIGSFKQPSILPKLLMDFVSQYCFRLPNERKCHRRKSCSGGFSKASDLLQALSVMEEKDTAGVQNTGNDRRRGIPTRLYKRCLREANVLAQITQI
ncbi:group 3 secretory phospholipase A2-like [Pseudoliparis swirei]|uniref:group 3 secretory phospholipase A2-like n=1 Tax=Pseudoliparis swirei TaxID=2059687 RepID=UPI0024BEE3EF|nr:group 3 secretory phospholipase A2-like [Pseudoliparis swirei]